MSFLSTTIGIKSIFLLLRLMDNFPCLCSLLPLSKRPHPSSSQTLYLSLSITPLPSDCRFEIPQSYLALIQFAISISLGLLTDRSIVWNSVLFCSVLFCSVLFCSVLFWGYYVSDTTDRMGDCFTQSIWMKHRTIISIMTAVVVPHVYLFIRIDFRFEYSVLYKLLDEFVCLIVVDVVLFIHAFFQVIFHYLVEWDFLREFIIDV